MPVSKRKDNGKWGYRLYIRGTNYRRFIYNTREEALQAQAELVDKLCREVTIISSDLCLVDGVNKFLEHSAKIGKSLDRLRALHYNFKTFMLPFFGPGKKIKTITHNDIYAFIDQQLKRDITKNTINHYVIDLNALLNWAVDEEVIKNNPMKKVSRKHIKPEKIIKRYHTPEQIQKCESVLSGEERLFFRFLKFTGARLTEALSAQWLDVDYENREIIIKGTKTKESFRKLPMCEALIVTLKELEAYRNGSEYLFHHDDGSRKLRRDKIFKRISEQTAISAKDLRDYFGSMIAMGVDGNKPDIVTVSRMMGHTNLVTTNKYMYSLKESMEKAVSVLDGLELVMSQTSPETHKKGLARGLTPCNHWWRCRDSNPGHCGYEPHALAY